MQHHRSKVIRVYSKRAYYFTLNPKYLSVDIRFVTLCKAINNIPSAYKKSTYALKSELLDLSKRYNSALNRLNMFNVRSKKDTTRKTKQVSNNNFVGKPRHYPPANNE